jgi:hypothetical protein
MSATNAIHMMLVHKLLSSMTITNSFSLRKDNFALSLRADNSDPTLSFNADIPLSAVELPDAGPGAALALWAALNALGVLSFISIKLQRNHCFRKTA